MPRIARPTSRWKPRLIIDVRADQYWKLKNNLEYGMQRRVFSIIIDDMIKMIDEYGGHFIVALLQREISYNHLMEEYTKHLGGQDPLLAPRDNEGA